MREINVKWKIYENSQDILVPRCKSKNYTTNGYRLYNNVMCRSAKVDISISNSLIKRNNFNN